MLRETNITDDMEFAMLFAWIAVLALCSIHLIFSLITSWQESKKYPYRVRRFHGINYAFYAMILGYLYLAPIFFSGEYHGTNTLRETLVAYGGPILILGLALLVARHDLSYIDITSEGFLIKPVFGRDKFTPFDVIDGYVYSPEKKRRTLDGQHWRIDKGASDDLFMVDPWGNVVFSCTPAKPQERIFGAFLYVRARAGRWPNLNDPSDEVVILRLLDSKYEVTDFLMEYPQVNGFIAPAQNPVPQQPGPPHNPVPSHDRAQANGQGPAASGQGYPNGTMNSSNHQSYPPQQNSTPNHNQQPQNQHPPQGGAS